MINWIDTSVRKLDTSVVFQSSAGSKGGRPEVSRTSPLPAALGREALAEVIALHDAEQAMDYVTCGSGSYFDFYKLMPTFLYPEKLGVDLAEVLKGVVSHAVVTAESHIRTPENAEAVLAAGQADLVSIVRGQIADPHLVAKAKAGRPEDVRACISCNQMCWGRRSRDYWISCLINPSAGRESDWGGDRFTPGAGDKVLVVGGGPAGLEAARAAAERGCHVPEAWRSGRPPHGCTGVSRRSEMGFGSILNKAR